MNRLPTFPILALALAPACGATTDRPNAPEGPAPSVSAEPSAEPALPTASATPVAPSAPSGAPSVMPVPGPSSSPAAGKPAAGTCISSKDCAADESCQGSEGCGTPWTCAKARPCTRDLVAFCSCDGQTVRGSSTCPPQPYAHKGPCK